jgi:uncharacterized protein (DUF849 family)
MNKVIITCAIIGAAPTRDQNSHIPITPEEIADSAIEAHQAGASIVHIHVRDPETHVGANDPALFTRVVERIRAKCDVILNLSTGHGGGLFIPADGKMTDADGHIIKDYFSIQTPEERVEHVLQLKPEICSLDIGSMNFGLGLFINAPGLVDKMAEMIRDVGTKPEIELFDVGHIEIANNLIKNGLIAGKPHYQLCMGTTGGTAATPKNAVHFSECLSGDCTWSIFGVGRTQFPMAAMGVLLDGHVRVGFEDNLYLEKGVKAKSNGELVERAAKIVRDLNKEVATADEAREILELK